MERSIGERRDYYVQMCEYVQFTYYIVYFRNPVAGKNSKVICRVTVVRPNFNNGGFLFPSKHNIWGILCCKLSIPSHAMSVLIGPVFDTSIQLFTNPFW